MVTGNNPIGDGTVTLFVNCVEMVDGKKQLGVSTKRYEATLFELEEANLVRSVMEENNLTKIFNWKVLKEV